MSKDCYKCDVCGSFAEGSPPFTITLESRARFEWWMGTPIHCCSKSCACEALENAAVNAPSTAFAPVMDNDTTRARRAS